MAPARVRLIVVGASAGGVEALTALVRALPADFPAAVAIVLHVASSGTSLLPAILGRAGSIRVQAARDGQAVEAGCVVVAPPDQHLTVLDGQYLLRHGPRENGHRPAIDPLFASAADAYGGAAIGVILTGALDDGAAGLAAIKVGGGLAVVQDPDDALYSGMPVNALARVEPDHVVPLVELAPLLVELARDDGPMTEPPPDPPPHAERPGPELDASPGMPAGEAAGLSCPECGGSLWYVDDNGTFRFRCRIGHAYSDQSLLREHARSLEAALWTALRALEERAALLRRMASRAADAGRASLAADFRTGATDLDKQAAVVRDHIVPMALESDPEAVSG